MQTKIKQASGQSNYILDFFKYTHQRNKFQSEEETLKFE